MKYNIFFKNVIKFLFTAIILQFLVQNIITRQIGISNIYTKILFSRKEILLVILFLTTTIYGLKHKESFSKQVKAVFYLLASFWASIIIFFIIGFFVHSQGIGEIIMAYKYDLLGYFTGLAIFFTAVNFLKIEDIENILSYITKSIKIILVGGLIRYIILNVKPGIINRLGYDTGVIEGKVNQRPPVLYLTEMNSGLVRNQFIFERPTTYGFFLTALFPLFYLYVLSRKSVKKNLGWRFLYGFNVISTFSRASIGVFIIEILYILIVFEYKKIKNYFKKIVLPMLALLLFLGYFFSDHILSRSFSSIGHITAINHSIKLIQESPLFGHGANFAGPGSHQETNKENKRGFNPENQFLQIILEFGFIGFIPRFTYFVYICLLGYIYKTKETKLISIGLISLGISGIVLHSLGDRMVTIPFFICVGLIIANIFIKNNQTTAKFREKN